MVWLEVLAPPPSPYRSHQLTHVTHLVSRAMGPHSFHQTRHLDLEILTCVYLPPFLLNCITSVCFVRSLFNNFPNIYLCLFHSFFLRLPLSYSLLFKYLCHIPPPPLFFSFFLSSFSTAPPLSLLLFTWPFFQPLSHTGG